MNESGPRETAGERDRELVERVRKGDDRAFEMLVLVYQERIFRLIRRMLNHREGVEDLAQEVFLRAYRSLDGFRGQSSFYTWLYKIALNTCRNYYRTMGRRPEGSVVDSESLIDGMESATPNPEAEAVRSELWDTVQGSLQELPPEQREAVVLCDLEGLSYEEMASVIGIPVGTVRSRVFRGRKALQQRLAPLMATRHRGEEEKN